MHINQLLDKIPSIPKDNTLYLLEKFSSKTGIFVSNGNILYLVLNEEHCSSMSIETDLLCLETNIFISAFSSTAQSFKNGYYNSVELDLSDANESEANLSAFINLCLAHTSYMQGQDFIKFFDSLVSLFQLPREQHYKNLIGLAGEILLIEYVYNNFGLDLSTYWHTDGSSSKLDFVCPFANLEIKTTASDSLSFTIKHDQLFTNANNNYLLAVVVEENNAGRTLEKVIAALLESSDYCNSLKFAINIEKEKRRISLTDLHNKHFILKKIYAYHAVEINPFDNIPDSVESLSYKLNLLPFPDVPIKNLFQQTTKLHPQQKHQA